MMNKNISIWMPIYIGDLQAKFARMRSEQVGATLLLMMDFWKNGAIPDDLATLCSITKLSQNTRAKNLLKTLKLFEVDDEHIHSKFLTDLKSQAMQNQQMRSEKAKNAAQARWNKSASNAQASNHQMRNDAQASDEQNLSIAPTKLKLSPSSE